MNREPLRSSEVRMAPWTDPFSRGVRGIELVEIGGSDEAHYRVWVRDPEADDHGYGDPGSACGGTIVGRLKRERMVCEDCRDMLCSALDRADRVLHARGQLRDDVFRD
jgi:hypothetical protein